MVKEWREMNEEEIGQYLDKHMDTEEIRKQVAHKLEDKIAETIAEGMLSRIQIDDVFILEIRANIDVKIRNDQST